MTKQEKIEILLEEMSDSELLGIFNIYCDNVNVYSEGVYSMEDFDELMSGWKPWEIARSCFYGDFRPCDKYFSFNGYGNLISFDHINDEINIYEIAEYIVDNNNALYNDKIQKILDEDEESEDEENEE